MQAARIGHMDDQPEPRGTDPIQRSQQFVYRSQVRLLASLYQLVSQAINRCLGRQAMLDHPVPLAPAGKGGFCGGVRIQFALTGEQL